MLIFVVCGPNNSGVKGGGVKAKGVKAQLPLTRGNRHPHLPMCWKTYPLFVYTCLSAAAAKHKAKGEVNAPQHMCAQRTRMHARMTLCILRYDKAE